MLDNLIKQNAQQFGLDPDFLRAVIFQESGNDPGAVSPVGAAGYMQIMPDTARQPGFGVPPMADPDKDRFDPQKNVQFGANYLRKLMDRYNGDAKSALVAYNWGAGNADKWLAKGGNIDDLPGETKGYITKIKSLYEQAKSGKAPERGLAQTASSTYKSAKDRMQELQQQIQQGPSLIRAMQERESAGPPASTGVQRVKDEAEWATKAVGAGLLDTVGLLTMMVDGPFELTTPLVNQLDEVSQGLRDSVPEWMKPALHKKIFKETADGGIEFDWPSLRQIANLTLESLSPGGAIVGGGKLALRGLGKVRKLEKLIERFPKMAAATSLGAANSTYIAADTYKEVYNRVLEQAQAEGMTLKEAHDEASRSASFGATIAGAIAFPTGALGEGLAATGKSLWSRLAKGVVFGSTTEAPEEAGQYLAEQIGSDQPIKLAEFLERGALGAFGAGPVEGVMAALSGNTGEAPAPPPPTPEIAEGLAAGDEQVRRTTEEIAKQVPEGTQLDLGLNEPPENARIKGPEIKDTTSTTAPATPDTTPNIPEPIQQELVLPDQPKGIQKFARNVVAKNPQVGFTLSDGSTQHREPPHRPADQNGGLTYSDIVVSEDRNSVDQVITYKVYPKQKTITIRGVGEMKADQRGTGKGSDIYENLIRDWLDQGYTVHSDALVSQESAFVYNQLSRKGYDVTQNESFMSQLDAEGNMGWIIQDPSQKAGTTGVFTITSAPPGPPNQRNMSLRNDVAPDGQRLLGQSSPVDVLAEKPTPKPTPRTRSGKFLKKPGELVPDTELEPNPAQQELPLPTLLHEAAMGTAPPVEEKTGLEALREPPQPPEAIIAQFEKMQTRFKKLQGKRLMNPATHGYTSRKNAKDSKPPHGSQIVKIGERFYVAAPAGPSTVYENTTDTWVPTKQQEKIMDKLAGVERKIDRHFYDKEEMVQDYRMIVGEYNRAKKAGDENMMEQLDAVGTQLSARWKKEYDQNIKDEPFEKPELTPQQPTQPAGTTQGPVAAEASVTSPPAEVPPSPAVGTEQAAEPTTQPAPLSTPEEAPLEAPVVDEELSTAVDGTPESDKVARAPHTSPEQRDGDPRSPDDRWEQAKQEEQAEFEKDLEGLDVDDSIPVQSSTKENQTRRAQLRAKRKALFEDLFSDMVKMRNVTWHALWYKFRGEHHTNAGRGRQYRSYLDHLKSESYGSLMKRAAKTYLTVMRMYVQDSFLPVRQVQDVLKEFYEQTGQEGAFSDAMDFYLAHELMHSKVDEQWERMNRNYFDKLAEMMRGDSTHEAVTQEELNLYLWYTHAPWRNKYITKKREQISAETVAGNPNPAGISTEEATEKRRELVKGRERSFQRLDKAMRNITQNLRDQYRKYDLVPTDMLDQWNGDPNFQMTYDTDLNPVTPSMPAQKYEEQMFYATYVPLMDMDVNPYEALLQNLFGEQEESPAVDVFGDEVNQAYGRTTAPDAMVAHLKLMTHTAIIRGERNHALYPLYEMAANNPNDLLWEVEEGDFVSGETMVDPLTGLPVTVEESAQQSSESAQRRAMAKLPGIVPGRAGDKNVGVFRMKKDGKIYTVKTFYAPLTMAIRNSERLPKTMVGLKAASGFSRWIAVANTTLSPGFAVANLIRDFITAKINLSEQNGLEKLNEHVTMRNWKHAMKAYWGSQRNAGMPDQQADPEGHKWRQLVERYRAAGGHTAFFQMRSAMDHYREIERLSRENMSKADPRSIGAMLKAVYNVMNDGNTAIENAVRLIAFAAAIDPAIGGHTDAQAASIAKNLTVNFQKRGHYSVVLGSLYVFFNATMQGNVRILGALRRSPKVRRITYGIAAGGMVNAIMQEMLGGDDDDGQSWYSKVPEHVRERNWVFMIPNSNGRYVSIPLPYGFNAFWVAGDSMGSAVFHDPTNPGPDQHDLLMRPLAAFHNTFNPVSSSSFIRSLTPTFAEPVHDIVVNRNYFGSMINPEKSPFDETPPPDAFNVLDPDQNRIAQSIVQTLGKLTGGNPVSPGKIDIAPGTLRYLFEYLGGSGLAGATLTRTMDALPLMLQGDFEKATRKTPVVRRLYGMTPEFNHKERYYQLRSFLANLKEEKDYFRSQRRTEPELYKDFMEENQVFWSTNVVRRVEATDRRVKKLTKARNKIRGMADKTPAQHARMQMYNDQIDRLIQSFNDTYYTLVNRNQL